MKSSELEEAYRSVPHHALLPPSEHLFCSIHFHCATYLVLSLICFLFTWYGAKFINSSCLAGGKSAITKPTSHLTLSHCFWLACFQLCHNIRAFQRMKKNNALGPHVWRHLFYDVCDRSHACAWAVSPPVGISNFYFCTQPVETYYTLLSFGCVGLNHCCWHCSPLMPFGQYQRKESVCLLVCFGCACVLVCLPRGKWKGCIGMGMKNSGSLPSHQTI